MRVFLGLVLRSSWLLVLCLLPGVGWTQAYFLAQLSGEQENPPVAGAGSGDA